VSNPVAGIDIVARLDQFRAELAKIPDIGGKEAKALAAQMSKEIRAAEKAALAAAKASRTAADATRDFGDKAGKAGQSASKLAGFLGLISPEAAEAARTIADLADVGEVAAEGQKALGLTAVRLGAILPPVAVAAAALGAAYLYLSAEAEKANAKMEASAKRAAEAQVVYENLSKIQLRAADAELVATGKATAADLALRDSLAEVTAAYAPLIAAKEAEYQASLKKDGAYGVEREATQRLHKELDGLLAAQGAVLQSTVRGNVLGREDAKVKGEQAKAVDATADALARQAAALREAIALSEEDSRLTAEVASGIDDLRAVARSAAESRLAGEEKVRAALSGRLDQLESEYQAIIRLASTDAERAAAADALQAARIETERSSTAEIDKIREDAAEKEAQRIADLIAKQREQDRQQLQSTADLFGAVSAVASTARESMNEEDKDAQAAAFAVQQAAAMGQALVNAALGVSEAAASAPPPLNAVPIAAAIGQGIANVAAVAAVAAPTFNNDTPGAVSIPQRTTMSFGAGDHVIAARDPREVQRQANALAGADPHADYRSGGPTVSIVGPRAFGRRLRDDVRFRISLARKVFSSTGRASGQAGRRS
jgi:hypothetical protein